MDAGGFEWDDEKAASNFEKHGVTFAEAATVFDDPLSAWTDDLRHSADEDRFLIVGMSARNRILVVIHTDREGRIRIIRPRSHPPRAEGVMKMEPSREPEDADDMLPEYDFSQMSGWVRGSTPTASGRANFPAGTNRPQVASQMGRTSNRLPNCVNSWPMSARNLSRP